MEQATTNAADEPTVIPGGLSLPWWSSLALFVFAFGLRVFHIGQTTFWLDDRALNVTNAFAYVRHGLLGPDNWWTQPLKHVLLFLGISVFGNDSVGWGMRNALFGAGVAVITFLIARTLFRSTFTAIAAGVLVALDPLSIVFSRNTSEDTVATFFILLTMWLFIHALRTDRDAYWIFTGLSFGVALALRWYAVIPGFVMLALALARRREGGLPQISRVLGYMGLLPIAVYALSYLPWAQRGYSVAELVALNMDAYQVQASGLRGVIELEPITGPIRWFTVWVGAYTSAYQRGSVVAMFNDLPLWFLFVPATAFLLWRGYQRRSFASALVGGSFALLYAFFLISGRPIFLYSSLPVVPLGFIAAGFAADRLLREKAWVFLAAAVVWSAYLYPLASGIPVPLWAYGWLLAKFTRAA